MRPAAGSKSESGLRKRPRSEDNIVSTGRPAEEETKQYSSSSSSDDEGRETSKRPRPSAPQEREGHRNRSIPVIHITAVEPLLRSQRSRSCGGSASARKRGDLMEKRGSNKCPSATGRPSSNSSKNEQGKTKGPNTAGQQLLLCEQTKVNEERSSSEEAAENSRQDLEKEQQVDIGETATASAPAADDSTTKDAGKEGSTAAQQDLFTDNIAKACAETNAHTAKVAASPSTSTAGQDHVLGQGQLGSSNGAPDLPSLMQQMIEAGRVPPPSLLVAPLALRVEEGQEEQSYYTGLHQKIRLLELSHVDLASQVSRLQQQVKVLQEQKDQILNELVATVSANSTTAGGGTTTTMTSTATRTNPTPLINSFPTTQQKSGDGILHDHQQEEDILPTRDRQQERPPTTALMLSGSGSGGTMTSSSAVPSSFRGAPPPVLLLNDDSSSARTRSRGAAAAGTTATTTGSVVGFLNPSLRAPSSGGGVLLTDLLVQQQAAIRHQGFGITPRSSSSTTTTASATTNARRILQEELQLRRMLSLVAAKNGGAASSSTHSLPPAVSAGAADEEDQQAFFPSAMFGTRALVGNEMRTPRGNIMSATSPTLLNAGLLGQNSSHTWLDLQRLSTARNTQNNSVPPLTRSGVLGGEEQGDNANPEDAGSSNVARRSQPQP